MKDRPIIGIALDCDYKNTTTNVATYSLQTTYSKTLSQLGAITLAIPHEYSLINEYIKLVDGLIITGGGLDVPPEYYGSLKYHQSITADTKRTEFEMELTKAFLKTNKPLLGIGGGQELLSVIFGGNIIQDIPTNIGIDINHEQPGLDYTAHAVTIKAETLLAKIVKKDKIEVNSKHHQATRDVPENIIINAIAPDGVIEGIENPKYHFCLGVLWHPEYLTTQADSLIFQAFIKACK